jgi:carboxylesterase type B
MSCGSRRIASKFSSYGLPSYLYTYNHRLSATSSCSGVAHASELPMLFPSYLTYFLRNYTLTSTDQQLSTNMMLYWAHFIHNSNPNYNGSPAIWDVYRNSTDNDFVPDVNPQMRSNHYNPTCSRLGDRYAVTNNTFTSLANTYTNKYQYFLLLFSSACVYIRTNLNFS